MPRRIVILKIESSYFTVRLYEKFLKIDLKGSTKNQILEALENKQILKETLGRILGIFVPLHIRLSDVRSVHTDDSGNVKVILPNHRNVTVPLEPNHAKMLVEKMNHLISKERERKRERIVKEQEQNRKRKRQQYW